MAGMQEEFVSGVRELHKATRPHVNYVKDFERRAEKNPKACANEALNELMAGTEMLQSLFKQFFKEDFEEAYNRTHYFKPAGTLCVERRRDAVR